MASGAHHPPAPFWMLPGPHIGLNGNPLWKVTIPPNCQPPRMALTAEFVMSNCRPRPKGSSYRKDVVSRCRKSKADSPRSRHNARSGSIGVSGSPSVVRTPDPLSIDFEYAYDPKS